MIFWFIICNGAGFHVVSSRYLQYLPLHVPYATQPKEVRPMAYADHSSKVM